MPRSAFVRHLLSLLALVAVAGAALMTAQTPGAATAVPALPLDNLGLEHLDIVVPDPAASAKFYARIFKTTLHQQPLRDTIRYFVLLGDLPVDRQVGYIAIGAAAPGRIPSIGHYCTLAKVYDRGVVIARLRELGAKVIDSADEPDVLRFLDDNGIVVELTSNK